MAGKRIQKRRLLYRGKHLQNHENPLAAYVKSCRHVLPHFPIAQRGKRVQKRSLPTAQRGICLAGIAIMCLTLLVTQTTLGYLTAESSIVNVFSINDVRTGIEELFHPESLLKENVCVKNQGKGPVYVRAKVLIYWETAAGTILPEIPQQKKDYTIQWASSEHGWINDEKHHTYYYSSKLTPGAVTSPLLVSCKAVDSHQDGRRLVVDILEQGIQASPEAVAEAWPAVQIDGAGCLSLKPTEGMKLQQEMESTDAEQTNPAENPQEGQV